MAGGEGGGAGEGNQTAGMRMLRVTADGHGHAGCCGKVRINRNLKANGLQRGDNMQASFVTTALVYGVTLQSSIVLQLLPLNALVASSGLHIDRRKGVGPRTKIN